MYVIIESCIRGTVGTKLFRRILSTPIWLSAYEKVWLL